MKIVKKYLQTLSDTEFRKEQEPFSLPERKLGLPISALGGIFGTVTFANGVTLAFSPDDNLPSVVSGYALEPSENLILNGDFSQYAFRGATSYLFSDWTFWGSPNASSEATPIVGTSREILYTMSGPLGNSISSTTAEPVFSSNGSLSNSVTFDSRYHLGWEQSFASIPGQDYLLEFDLIGNVDSDFFTYANGVSVVHLDGYDPLVLESVPNATTTYQLRFTADQDETLLRLFDIGYAHRFYSSGQVSGWNIPDGTITSRGGWDNVSVVPIPEPAATSFLMFFLVACYAFFRRKSK